ncbi:unnamed protein product, partial [Amoebophrya sp. A25]
PHTSTRCTSILLASPEEKNATTTKNSAHFYSRSRSTLQLFELLKLLECFSSLFLVFKIVKEARKILLQ